MLNLIMKFSLKSIPTVFFIYYVKIIFGNTYCFTISITQNNNLSEVINITDLCTCIVDMIAQLQQISHVSVTND